jgi:hypothetical protein
MQGCYDRSWACNSGNTTAPSSFVPACWNPMVIYVPFYHHVFSRWIELPFYFNLINPMKSRDRRINNESFMRKSTEWGRWVFRLGTSMYKGCFCDSLHLWHRDITSSPLPEVSTSQWSHTLVIRIMVSGVSHVFWLKSQVTLVALRNFKDFTPKFLGYWLDVWKRWEKNKTGLANCYVQFHKQWTKTQAFSPIFGQMVNDNGRDIKYRCRAYKLQAAVTAKIHARRLNRSGFFFSDTC